jgi:hypothetical protein
LHSGTLPDWSAAMHRQHIVFLFVRIQLPMYYHTYSIIKTSRMAASMGTT